ncbi:MAG: RNA methyltransferase, partial [Bauldia sp.]|nr:RNA methyltransferase [Bauldia sp.]
MTEIVTIAALGHGGDGIAETAGGRVFVPFTLPGETVEIERTGNRGRVTRVVTESAERAAPVCRHFGTCGGCALQHMERAAYLEWKRQIVTTSFALHGIDVAVEPVVATAAGGRRRAIFSAVNTAKGVVVGFNRRGSQEIVAVEECPVLAPGIVEKLGVLREIAALALRPGKRARLTVLSADNGLDIAITGGGKLAGRALSALGRFGTDPSLARLTVDGSEIFRNRQPEIAAGGAALLPAPGGFVQAAGSAEAALAEAVTAHFGDAAPVADPGKEIG